jgi:hypothetical protein
VKTTVSIEGKSDLLQKNYGSVKKAEDQILLLLATYLIG